MLRPLAFAALALLAPAAVAQSPAHQVRFAEPPAQGERVVRDVLWDCAGTACTGGRSRSRPLVVCQSVARALGPVAEFSAAGRALDADALGRCNARAAPR